MIVNSHIEHEHDHRILKQTLATFGKHGARPTNLKLVREVNSVVKLSKDRNMTISKTKTKGILLNPLRKYDFEPQLSIEQGCYVEVVEEQKILGHIIRSDMETISNKEFICKKAHRMMWFLRRLKSLGCPNAELIELIKKQFFYQFAKAVLLFWGP